MVNNYKTSFCDSSILIDLKLGLKDTFDKFIAKQNKIYIADTVHNELKNLLYDMKDYKYIYDDLFHSHVKTEIIYYHDFTEDQLSVIHATLKQFDLKVSLVNNELCPDLGEFVSSLYSKYKKINVVRTSDNTFIKNYSNQYIFRDITFINLHSTLEEFLENNVKKVTIAKIYKDNEVFSSKKEDYRLAKKMEHLVNNFESRRLK